MKKLTFVLLSLVLGVSMAVAQSKQITGTVIFAEDGEPIIGASVVVKGTTTGTVTDFDGNFELSVPASAKTMVFSYIGMTTVEKPIQSILKVTMTEDAQSLDELVVVGYGTQKKKDVTSSISRVKGDDLANLATPSFDSQIAGRAAGVQVIQPSGVLGAAPMFRVRGVNSLSSSTEPLIVVDGMPVISGDISNSYVKSNAMADINPNDIASIEILKDGAATAIYGSRAANGVVLITTKKGVKGSVKVNYDGYVGVASASNTHDLLNGEQFVQIANEKYATWGEKPLAVYDGTNTDWNDHIYRDAFQQNHSLNASGGTDKSQYYLSLGYTGQDGIIVANDLERLSAKADVSSSLTKWLKIGANLAATRTVINGIVEGGSSISDASFSGIRMLPNVSVYNAEDPTGFNIDTDNRKALGRGSNLKEIDNGIPNIAWALDNNVNRSSSYRITSNAYAELDLLKGLKFKTQGGLDIALMENFMKWAPQSGDGYGYGGLLSQTNTNYTNWNWQNILMYNTTFNEVHNLDLTGVQEYTYSGYHYTDGTVMDMSDPFFMDNIISGTYGTQEVNGGKSFNGLASYMFRANYNYDSKYYIGGSIRYDGLSRLPKETRWGTFWGASAAWRISKENFWVESAINDVVSDLRFRASYATIGNQDINGNFPYLGAYSPQKYGGQTAIAWNNMGNSQLKWETTETFDVGVDASLFHGRMNVELAYWKKESKDLVLDVPTPPSLGVPGDRYTQNVGSISNKGFEFTVGGLIIDNSKFSWRADLNFSTLDNKVNKLVNGADIIGGYNIIREGESMNAIYGYEYAGVNAANGYPMWHKADGSIVQFDLLGSYSHKEYDPNNPSDVSKPASLDPVNDKKVLGSAIPTWFGGFNNTLTWNNFDMNIFFRFSGGNSIMNATRQDLLNMEFSNNGTEILGRWQSVENPGDGMTPILGYGDGGALNNEQEAVSRFVEDGSYLKLSNLSIGYSLPKSVIEDWKISRFRMYVSGQNLFTITDYSGLDPEIVTALDSGMVGKFGVDWNGKAQQRVFTFGVNIGF